jgi:hypothetical protein
VAVKIRRGRAGKVEQRREDERLIALAQRDPRSARVEVLRDLADAVLGMLAAWQAKGDGAPSSARTGNFTLGRFP